MRKGCSPGPLLSTAHAWPGDALSRSAVFVLFAPLLPGKRVAVRENLLALPYILSSRRDDPSGMTRHTTVSSKPAALHCLITHSRRLFSEMSMRPSPAVPRPASRTVMAGSSSTLSAPAQMSDSVWRTERPQLKVSYICRAHTIRSSCSPAQRMRHARSRRFGGRPLNVRSGWRRGRGVPASCKLARLRVLMRAVVAHQACTQPAAWSGTSQPGAHRRWDGRLAVAPMAAGDGAACLAPCMGASSAAKNSGRALHSRAEMRS